MVCVLRDMMPSGVKLVFVGEAVGDESAYAGHYYASARNVFWRHLRESGLTRIELTPELDHELPKCGMGLTDIVKCLTNSQLKQQDKSGAISPDHWRQWVCDLERRLKDVAPRAVCFNGKGVARRVLRSGCEWCKQKQEWANAQIWVVPSSSPRASRWHPMRLEILNELARDLGKRDC